MKNDKRPAPGGAKRPEEAARRGFPLWTLILTAFAALILVGVICGILHLTRLGAVQLTPGKPTRKTVDPAQYIAEYWDWYEFKSWDEQTGTLELTAPINSKAEITLEQARKYALLDGVRYDELALSDAESLKKMRFGQNGEGAVGDACGG